MKNLKSNLLIIISVLTIISSCQMNSGKTNDQISIIETEKSITVEKPKYNKLIGKGITIRVGPGNEFEKLVNKKATELLGETHYCNVDYTFLVEILEQKNDWAKIRTIKPEHLSQTYTGWIPYSSIKLNNEPEVIEELNKDNYEVFYENHMPTVNNYHILIKQKGFDETKAQDFIKSFRKFNSNGKSNICLYDSKGIKSLIDKYPLEGAEYIKFADHFIAMSSFDAPELVWWYPYQDVNYKDYGGKNWKKEPIK